MSDEETDQLVDALGLADTPTFDMIGDALLDELWRRLKDPIAVMDLPAAQLMRLSQEYMKLRQGRDPAPEREVFQTPELILDANLPRERKHQLLVAQAEKAARQIRDCEEAMRRLNQ